MLGTLYAHVPDSGRFLLVRRDKSFPADRYNQKEWRVVAVGVEPMSDAASAGLLARGFFAYRTEPA